MYNNFTVIHHYVSLYMVLNFLATCFSALNIGCNPRCPLSASMPKHPLRHTNKQRFDASDRLYMNRTKPSEFHEDMQSARKLISQDLTFLSVCRKYQHHGCPCVFDCTICRLGSSKFLPRKNKELIVSIKKLLYSFQALHNNPNDDSMVNEIVNRVAAGTRTDQKLSPKVQLQTS